MHLIPAHGSVRDSQSQLLQSRAAGAVHTGHHSLDGRLRLLIYDLTVKWCPALWSNQQLTQEIFTPSFFFGVHFNELERFLCVTV